MSVFRQPPFNLLFTDLIVARVKATNVIGDGLYSDNNTSGVRVQTEPDSPINAPEVLSYNEQTAEL